MLASISSSLSLYTLILIKKSSVKKNVPKNKLGIQYGFNDY
jgi:hypothetical protein